MQIGRLASETGLSRETLRFYEQRGLIRSTRSANSYRTYAPETVQLIAYIRMAQRLGFSLSEIGESLPELWNSATPDQAIAELLLEKVAVIDRKIEELAGLKKELLERVAQSCPFLTGGSADQAT
ncbi:MAG: MerR family transcriptional regulator [Burkholderiaceae bacterium]